MSDIINYQLKSCKMTLMYTLASSYLSDPPRLRQPTMKHGFGPPPLFFGLSRLVRSNSMQNDPFPGSGPCTGPWNGPQGRRAHLVGFGGQISKMLQFIQFLSNFSDILSKVATQEAPEVVFSVDLTKMHRNVIYGQYQLGQGRPDLPQRQFFLSATPLSGLFSTRIDVRRYPPPLIIYLDPFTAI